MYLYFLSINPYLNFLRLIKHEPSTTIVIPSRSQSFYFIDNHLGKQNLHYLLHFLTNHQHKVSYKSKKQNFSLTFLDHSSKSSPVLSLFLKLSPSALSFCPSTWLSQPFPSTSSTRRRYADNWRSICNTGE